MSIILRISPETEGECGKFSDGEYNSESLLQREWSWAGLFLKDENIFAVLLGGENVL